MSWQTITTDDVLSEFTPQERGALEGIQGTAEALPGILGRAIASARGAIQAGGYALGDEGTVPDLLGPEVLAVARWRWLLAFPQLQRLQTPERQAAHEQARARFDAVARQALRIEPPRPGIHPPTGSWNSQRRVPGRMAYQPANEGDNGERRRRGPGAEPGGGSLSHEP